MARTRTSDHFARKLATTATSLAALHAPGVAGAAIIHETLSWPDVFQGCAPACGTNASFERDLDGDGQDDFEFDSGAFGAPYGTAHRISWDSLNGSGLVMDAGVVQALASGFQVGPTLATYGWGTGEGMMLSAVNSYPYPDSWTLGSKWGDVLEEGVSKLIGFRFTSPAGTHFGWARVRWTAHLTSGGFLSQHIIRWDEYAWETEAGVPIAAGSVPEPAPLALLAAGAGGIRHWRRRRQARAKAGDAA